MRAARREASVQDRMQGRLQGRAHRSGAAGRSQARDGAGGASTSGDDARIRSAVHTWLEEFVVGLSLCPFAGAPLAAGTVRFRVSRATTPEALFEDLMEELSRLDAAPPAEIETTLLIHPHVLGEFDAFNAFLAVADLAVERSGLAGVVQIASFHPGYVFAGASSDDPANATNRSPYPILHLLREASVTRAVEAYGDTSEIPRRNAKLLRERSR